MGFPPDQLFGLATDEPGIGGVGEGEDPLLIAHGQALTHRIHHLEREVPLLFDLCLGQLPFDKLAHLVSERTEELDEVLIRFLGLRRKELDDAEGFVAHLAGKRTGRLDAERPRGLVPRVVGNLGGQGDPRGLALFPDPAREAFPQLRGEQLQRCPQERVIAVRRKPGRFRPQPLYLLRRPEHRPWPSEDLRDRLQALGHADRDRRGVGQGLGHLVLESAAIFGADPFRDVPFQGHEVADLARCVPDRLDFQMQPVLLAILVVVEDLDLDRFTRSQLFPDLGHGPQIRLRTLEQASGLASPCLFEGVAGLADKPGVDPLDHAPLIGDDHRLIGPVGDEGELLGFNGLGLQQAVGCSQFRPLVPQALGQFLEIRDGRLLGLDALQEVQGRVMDGKVIEQQTELAQRRDIRQPRGPQEYQPPIIQRNHLPAQHDIRARDLDQEQKGRTFPDGFHRDGLRDLRFAKAKDFVELRELNEFRAQP